MAALTKENPLKDYFNIKVITILAHSIKKNFKDFKSDTFIEQCCNGLTHLGFLARSVHIKEMLYKFLPKKFEVAVDVLIRSLAPEIEGDAIGSFDNFVILSECDYVATYGVAHFDLSMHALYEMTKRMTAEGYLRVFIELDYKRSMETLHKWCDDKSPHVRRLVSEGTRSRLPLSTRIKRFQKDPTDVITLLNKLRDDESLYVRRSVANNINDIVKDNPHIAINTLELWKKDDKKEVDWVIRHASRSLLKEGNLRVLHLHGYDSEIHINVSAIIINKSNFSIGDTIEFSFIITSQETSSKKLMIDYIVNYTKTKGKRADKVFKMRDTIIKPSDTITITKIHKLKNTSGRKHYAGKHSISLQINGVKYSSIDFRLE